LKFNFTTVGLLPINLKLGFEASPTSTAIPSGDELFVSNTSVGELPVLLTTEPTPDTDLTAYVTVSCVPEELTIVKTSFVEVV